MSWVVLDFVEANAMARFATLPPNQQAVVKAILEERPDYRYDLAPPMYPPPQPGLPSALAAVMALAAGIKDRLR